MLKKERTIIYVDGFNLYYGCLKRSPYKWLDLKSLFQKLLNENHHISKIKYFTANISVRDGNEESRLRQKVYIEAISRYIPELEVYYGHYLTHEVNARIAAPEKSMPKFVKVYKTEEKGSDVNIALQILNDAWLDNYDCAVLVSNDSDLTEALQLVKEQHRKKIGLVFPNTSPKRKPSRPLAQYADFIKHIRPGLLSNCLLPDYLHYEGVNLKKPQGW